MPVHNFCTGRPGILQQLEQLSQRQRASTTTSLPKETAFDQRIRQLQEELDSMSRDQEILNINQFASVSNNPYFLGAVEGAANSSSSEKSSSLFTLKPREENRDVMSKALAQELDMLPSGVAGLPLQSVR